MKVIHRLRRIPGYLSRKFISVSGSKEYKKFIIISRSRSGSFLLITLLDSHPAIEAKGELFVRLNGRSCKEVWKETFCRKQRKIKYVGFKLFYYHPVDSSDREVWNFILNDPSIRIIHLTRNNLLRTIVSRKIAAKTEVWRQLQKENLSIEDKKVEIAYDECLAEFKKTKNWEYETEIRFKDHPYLQITYEELTDERENTMRRIFRFLEMEDYPVSTPMVKQNNEPLSDLIINYDALVTSLKQTEWAHFVE